LFGEGGFGLFGDRGGLQDSLERSFGSVVVFNGLGADSFFVDEFDGGAEEVKKESPFLGVEVIEEGDGFRVIEALVSEPLADMSPVFLFDMGVVIFVIGAAAGEVDGLFSLGEVSEEVVVEEFGAVIAVEAEEGKG
jgi:hypothetical protein